MLDEMTKQKIRDPVERVRDYLLEMNIDPGLEQLRRAAAVQAVIWDIPRTMLHADADGGVIAEERRLALMCAAALHEDRHPVSQLIVYAQQGMHWVVHRLLSQGPHSQGLKALYGYESEYSLTPQMALERSLRVGEIPGVSQSPHFTDDEWSSDDSGKVYLQPLTPILAEMLREKTGARPWTMTSGYRTPAHNRAVGGAPDSWHMIGLAFDLSTHNRGGVEAAGLIKTAQLIRKQHPHWDVNEVIPYAHKQFVHFAFEPKPGSKTRDRGVMFDTRAKPFQRVDPAIAARGGRALNQTAGGVLASGGLAGGALWQEAAALQGSISPVVAAGPIVALIIGGVILWNYGGLWFRQLRDALSWRS